jgi:hypothetical protein
MDFWSPVTQYSFTQVSVRDVIPVILIIVLFVIWTRRESKPYWDDKAKFAYRQINELYGSPTFLNHEPGGMARWEKANPFYQIFVTDEPLPLTVTIKYVTDNKDMLAYANNSKYLWYSDNLLAARGDDIHTVMHSLVAFDKMNKTYDTSKAVEHMQQKDMFLHLKHVSEKYERSEVSTNIGEFPKKK